MVASRDVMDFQSHTISISYLSSFFSSLSLLCSFNDSTLSLFSFEILASGTEQGILNSEWERGGEVTSMI